MMATPTRVTTPKNKPQGSNSGSGAGGNGMSAAGTPFVYTANPSNTNLSLVSSNPTPNYPLPGADSGPEASLLTTASSPIARTGGPTSSLSSTATPEASRSRPISASHVDISTDLVESSRAPDIGGAGGPGGKRASKRVQPNLGAEYSTVNGDAQNSVDFV